MQVATPISLVLSGLIGEMRSEATSLTTVFDPSLDYHEVIKGVRAYRHSLDLQSYSTMPILAFNRGPLIPFQEGINRRTSTLGTPVNGDAVGYKVRMCQTELRFKIFFKDVIMLDTFEVLYANHESFRSIKDFEITLSTLGDFKYFIDWGELESSEFTKVDGVYMSLDFTAKMWGNFLITDVSEKVILEINELIENYESVQFASEKIVE